MENYLKYRDENPQNGAPGVRKRVGGRVHVCKAVLLSLHATKSNTAPSHAEKTAHSAENPRCGADTEVEAKQQAQLHSMETVSSFGDPP